MKKILFAASECIPYIKTGGLADVIGALPAHIDPSRFDVRVVLPLYRAIPEIYRRRMQYVTHFYSYFNGKDRYVGIKTFQEGGIRYYFIDNEEYFGGPSPYTDYAYDIEKFAFFSKAVLSILPSVGFHPDIIHCHDWHVGLIPVYLKTEFAGTEYYASIRCIMTIHNLKFQGVYEAGAFSAMTGLPMDLMTIDKLRTYDDANMLKGGIVFADKVTTVSETYAREIMTPEYGEGLEGLFRLREKDFCGIVNGIDTERFGPQKDPALPARYGLHNYRKGKALCKAALQEELGLEKDDSVCLIGVVSRLTEQKGFSLVQDALEDILSQHVQLVVLGTGDPRFEELFLSASERWPGRVSAVFTYNEALSHRIYAACDAFLMPSQFEPCGLSQLIALRFGTLPLVRATGGLKDTVTPYPQEDACGFAFRSFSAEAMLSAYHEMIQLFFTQRTVWSRMVRQAMQEDYSWEASAARYEALYLSLT